MRHFDGWKWLEICPYSHTVTKLPNWTFKFNSESLALIAFALFSSSSPILTPIDYPVLGEHIDKHLPPRIHGYLSTPPTIDTFTLSQDSVIKMNLRMIEY